MGIDVIIVIYNKKIQQVQSLPLLQAADEVKQIIICDNSDVQNNDYHATSSCDKVTYIPMGGNVGLSKAYNTAVARVSSEFVLILDDDTKLPVDFFKKLVSNVKMNEADVYVPLVRSEKILMSPCHKGRYRFTAFDSEDDIRSPYSAINSGLLIRKTIFDSISYNNDLFLDMIDHAFFDNLRLRNVKSHVMSDIVLFQNYSRETDNEEKACKRFKITKKDNRVYYNHSFVGKVFCEIQLIFWKIKAMFKFNDFKVLFW